jgi:hypothetical protein
VWGSEVKPRVTPPSLRPAAEVVQAKRDLSTAYISSMNDCLRLQRSRVCVPLGLAASFAACSKHRGIEQAAANMPRRLTRSSSRSRKLSEKIWAKSQD